jgi:hypothetical protein
MLGLGLTRISDSSEKSRRYFESVVHVGLFVVEAVDLIGVGTLAKEVGRCGFAGVFWLERRTPAFRGRPTGHFYDEPRNRLVKDPSRPIRTTP